MVFLNDFDQCLWVQHPTTGRNTQHPNKHIPINMGSLSTGESIKTCNDSRLCQKKKRCSKFQQQNKRVGGANDAKARRDNKKCIMKFLERQPRHSSVWVFSLFRAIYEGFFQCSV